MQRVLPVLVLLAATAGLDAADLAGVVVRLEGESGPVGVTARLLEPFKLHVAVDPKGATKSLVLRVELPKTGRNAWPADDVEVRDPLGNALLVRRSGIEWGTLFVPLPEGMTSCIVQAVPPQGGWPRATSDKDRAIADDTSGFHLRIARWPRGRAAALSLRFDDSHPSHLDKAVPILREHGFRGTFMVNPGAPEAGSRRTSSFQQRRAEWEALAKRGDHEFANHSARHRGAVGDADMEREIGEAAEAIWKLTSGRSKLMALNLGGGTFWETTRTLRYYLDKFHQFDASSGSLGMDDSYGGRVEAFRKALAMHVERGLWCRVHYHYIGEGLSSSEASFRAALGIAKQNEASLWIAGMADIQKYQAERDAAKLTAVGARVGRLEFQLTCGANPALYDQPLTVEILRAPQDDPRRAFVKDAGGRAVRLSVDPAGPAAVARFEVPPKDAVYIIEAQP